MLGSDHGAARCMRSNLPLWSRAWIGLRSLRNSVWRRIWECAADGVFDAGAAGSRERRVGEFTVVRAARAECRRPLAQVVGSFGSWTPTIPRSESGSWNADS